jgi:dipeptide/tripeptide permease
VKDSKYAKGSVYQLLVYLGGLILFFAIEDQICSSLLLFTEREMSRKVCGWVIPSSYITAINPIVILLFGTFIAKKRLSMIIPFSITGGAFAILAFFCHLNLNLSILGIIGIVACISLAELMIGPLVFSYTSEIAAQGNAGMVMGIVPIAFSLAFQVSGGLGKMVTLEGYEIGFGLVALFSLIGGLVIHLLFKRGACEKNLMQNQ